MLSGEKQRGDIFPASKKGVRIDRRHVLYPPTPYERFISSMTRPGRAVGGREHGGPRLSAEAEGTDQG